MTATKAFRLALISTTAWKSNKPTQHWLHSIFKPEALRYGVNFMGQKALVLK